MIINSVFFRAGGFAGAALTMVPVAGHVVGAMVHSDMRAAYKALRRIYDLVSEIYNVIVLRDHICFAAVKYIEESTTTGRS